MSKQHKVRITTILIFAALLGVIVARKAGLRSSVPQSAEATPQDTIYGMLDAARAGDVKTYLAAYSGQMEQSLRRAISESPDFSKYLRNEVQFPYLERRPAGWRIAREPYVPPPRSDPAGKSIAEIPRCRFCQV